MDVWGVTFRNDGSFLASIRTNGNVHLVEGEVGSDELTIKAPNVSAPSLSPDGTRIAYAKLVSSIGPTWRLHVMDLETLEETPLAETRSIDEQPEWLDDDTILYGLATDIWSVKADGSGDPQPYLFGGLSPVVVNP
jgi:Tol biopolymer transport system component